MITRTYPLAEGYPLFIVIGDYGEYMLATKSESDARACDVVDDDAEEWIDDANNRITLLQKLLREACGLTSNHRSNEILKEAFGEKK